MHRADPNDTFVPTGSTALMTAVTRGPQAVELLLAVGVAVDARDVLGGTALSAAARSNRGDAVDALIAARARVEQANVYGATPLGFAARYGATDAVRRLLGAGADPFVHSNGVSLITLIRYSPDPDIEQLIGNARDEVVRRMNAPEDDMR